MAASKRERKKLARQQNNSAQKRVPNQGVSTETPKHVPGTAADPTPHVAERVRWTAREIDHGVSDDETCDWSWHLTSQESTDLLKFLEELTQKTWGEVQRETSGKHKKHHGHALDSICQAAQDRLDSQGLTAQGEEELFRFRLSGTRRLWGFKTGSLFKIIWWDKDHRVYPTEKRHT